MISIRLKRGGRIHKPMFTVVAADSRKPRDGAFLEKLGQYNPQEEVGKQLNDINVANMKAWISKGAQLSDTVRTLLKRNKIQLN